jgi:hypothetical protein
VKRPNRIIKWRCDRCRECIATVEDGWWRPKTDDDGDSKRASHRNALRLSHYGAGPKIQERRSLDVASIGDAIGEVLTNFVDLEMPEMPREKLAPTRLARLPRDTVLRGLCPRHGIRDVRIADVRKKARR